MHLGLLWVFLEKFGASFFSVAAFFVYAKYLGPSDLGVVVIVLSVTQFLAILIGTMFEDALVQKKELTQADTDTAFWTGITLSCVSILATLAGFYFLVEEVENYNIMALTVFACLEILLVNIGVIYVAQMRRDGQFKMLALRVLIGRIIGASLGLVAIFSGAGAWAVIIQSVAMAGIQTMILLYVARRLPGFQIDLSLMPQMLYFGSMLALRRLSWDAMVRLTPIAAGATLGTAAAGIVGFAWRIVELFRSAIASGLMSYLIPHLSRMQNDLPRMGREFEAMTAMIAFFVTPVFLGLFAIAPLMIETIFDEKWNGTVPLIQILCVSSALACTRLPTAMVTVAAGYPGKMMIPSLLITIFLIGVMFVFGHYGLWLFGVVFIFKTVLLMPISIGVTNEIVGVNARRQLLPVLIYGIPSIVMLGALLTSQYFFTDLWLINNMITQVIAGIILFCAIGIVFYFKDVKRWKNGLIRKPA